MGNEVREVRRGGEVVMRPQVPCQAQKGPNYVKERKQLELGATPSYQHQKGQRGRVEALGLDQEEGQAIHSLEPASNQPTSWLVHILEHLWCQDKPWATLDSLYSPQPGLGGSHHLPPYSIICAPPWVPHPNGFLSQDSQVGVPKLSRNCVDLDSQDFGSS